MSQEISLLHFDQLSKEQLYDMLQLRADVFVIEQASLYRDIDSQDMKAWHILCYNKQNQIIGVVRILKDIKDSSC
ncbi:hypothetical protein A9Q97_00495, partial [Rhodospirillales bacterium 47_12_T64]